MGTGDYLTTSPSPTYPFACEQPGAGSRGFREGRTDPSIPQTPSITTHTYGIREPCPPPLILTGMACWDCWGPRPHSEQECGCHHAGVSVNRNAGCGCLK